MHKNSGKRAFTLWENLIVVFVLVCIVGLIGGVLIGGGVIMANYWVNEESALKAVQVIEPSVTKVITLERKPWAYSVVRVEDGDGYQSNFYLDACILQNVTAIPVIDLATQN